MDKVDNSTYQIVNIPLDWYYLILEEKSKRPDYSAIVYLASLAELYFISQENNKDYIKFFRKSALELLNDIYKSADEYKNAEKHLFCCHLLKAHAFLKNKEIGFLAAFLLSDLIINTGEEMENNLSYKNLPIVSINKKNLLKLFNETPQKIRKALELLKKLDLITFKINKENIEITFSKEIQKPMT